MALVKCYVIPEGVAGAKVLERLFAGDKDGVEVETIEFPLDITDLTNFKEEENA